MDDLIYICTKIARQMDAQGVDKMFAAMESAQAAIEEAKPLLQRAVELSDEVCHPCGNPPPFAAKHQGRHA
jgi:hypothetical protein